MSRTTPSRRTTGLRACLAGAAGAALVAGVLTPTGALAATPTPSPTPSASPSASPSPRPTGVAGARPVLAAPQLLSPVEPVDVPQPVLKDVVLAWRAVPDARGYRVQVSQDGEFSDDEVTFDTTTPATRLALPASLPHAAYRWRVAAVQPTGHGFWSASGAFTKGWRERVTGLRSEQGARGEEFPTLAWAPVASASEYELQVSADPLFSADPTRLQAGFGTTACFTTRTRVTGYNTQAQARNDGAGGCDFTALRVDQQMYWRVRPLDHVADDEAETDTSPVVDDGISYQPLAPKSDELDTGPCPKPPSAGPTPSATPASSPTASPTAGSGAALSCEPAHRVESGSWSEVRTFVWSPEGSGPVSSGTYRPVAVAAPAAEHCTVRPAVAGEGRLSDCVEFPTLDWEPREGATGYRLTIALDDAFTNVHEIVETPGTEWTPTTAWRDTTASQTYYYAVQACTPVRCGTVPTAPDSFRKKSPRTQLTAPDAGTLVGATDVQLRWRPLSATQRAVLGARVAGAPATQEAYAYRVQGAEAPEGGRAATDADFQDPVEDAVVDGTLCRPTATGTRVDARATQRAVQSCTPGGDVAVHDTERDEVAYVSSARSYPTGSYVWRVQALDASAHKLPWSAVGTFSRDVTAPTATFPSGALAADAPLVVRFSERVTGLSVETVRLAPASASLVAAPDGRSVTLRPARTWVPGQAYALDVLDGVVDRAGNPLAPGATVAVVPRLVDDGSAALSYTGAWGFRTSTDAVGGGFRTSRPTVTRQTAAGVTVAGRGVVVTGCTGPTGGLADVWVDGSRRARVDTYRAYSGCGVVLARIAAAAGTHVVQVRGTGRKRPASAGTTVSLDAVTAL